MSVEKYEKDEQIKFRHFVPSRWLHPSCAAKAAIPCGLAVRKQHKMLFGASKFEKET